MSKSAPATTPAAYVDSVAPDHRDAIQAVRQVILDNLPEGYEEMVLGGMLMYVVPLSRLSDTYNRQPLCYVALAAQKNYMSVYLMSVYGDKPTEKWFREQFKARGKKLDMGKSCVRFKRLEDLPLDVIGETVSRVPMEKWVSVYQQSRKKPTASRRGRSGGGTRAAGARAR
jgi:hypothetical protein